MERENEGGGERILEGEGKKMAEDEGSGGGERVERRWKLRRWIVWRRGVECSSFAICSGVEWRVVFEFGVERLVIFEWAERKG